MKCRFLLWWEFAKRFVAYSKCRQKERGNVMKKLIALLGVAGMLGVMTVSATSDVEES